MKKIFILVNLVIVLAFNSSLVSAQCPGCVYSSTCISNPPFPTICPLNLPDGEAMQPYNQDISIYLPSNFTDPGTGYNLDLQQLDILNVVGLPFGLTFQTSAHPVNIFYPTSNPPASEHGCAKICGTPISAGTYTITVFILAHVKVNSLGGITTTNNSSFDLTLTIQPAVASNNGFTMVNSTGCSPLTTGFTANRHSNGNPNYHYTWNFGNGNMSIMEYPPSQTYINPGDYVVTLHTQIDTLPYFFSGLTVNAAPDCNDSPFSSPDYYFKLKQGSTTLYSSSYIDNSNAPVTFSFSPIVLNNTTYSLEIWEYDTGLAGGDDFCKTFNFPGYNAGTFTLTNGNVVITYTVNHPVLNYNDVDTVTVFESPVVSQIAFQPNDTVCQGDSIALSVTASPGCTFQWYNDTLAINNADAATYMAKSTGKYRVEVTNANGCRVNSNYKSLVFIENPPKPGTWISNNVLSTNLTGYQLQWYFEGNPINGATGMSTNITATGNYFVIATNWFGCSTSSDTVYATNSAGLDENNYVSNLQILPNPNNGKFRIIFTTEFNKPLDLIISDMTGRLVYKGLLMNYHGKVNEEIDISFLQKGIYLMKISAEDSYINSKVIIQ